MKHHDCINHFRPISMCNVLYKVVSKIMVERLKASIPKLVSPIKYGFVPRISIHENIIVSREIIHIMNKIKGNKGFFSIKVDLSKAYDKLS